jgi:VIT1/CCC1 family predicted Fe2+/Mn2+ transporter
MPVHVSRGHREGHRSGGSSLRDLVLGSNDGLVAAFAVTSGIHGAAISGHIVLVGGLAEVLGGTISMALGAYLATKSARDFYLAEQRREADEIDRFPIEEREEVRRAFAAEGFEGEVLEKIVVHVTADRGRWLRTMMDRELGLVEVPPGAAVRSGLATGLAYAAGAAMPTLPYLAPLWLAFPLSIAATLAALFAVGAAKSRVTAARWWLSGLESLGIGLAAAAATFLAGRLIGS